MGKKVRLGVIGAGAFSKKHLTGIKYTDTAEVIAISDIIEEKAKAKAQEYNVPHYYADYKELLKRDDIDAVTLPLPDQVHMQVTIDALYAGKHVLCEKPMALDLDECKEMIKAAKETGKQLMVGQIGRYTPGFVTAKSIVDNGEIGDLFFVESEYAHDYSKVGGEGNWRITPEREAIIGGGCHAVDLLRMIAGNPTETFAYANKKVLTTWPVNDCTVAVLKFPNDVIGKVMTSIGCKRTYTMRTVLYGTKGTIIVDNTSPTLSLFKDEFSQEDEFKNRNQQRIELKIPIEINNHNFAAEVAEFCESILAGRPVATDGIEGASTVAACLAIVNSAKKEEKVKIKYDF
jgi:predicted dehydrogenase